MRLLVGLGNPGTEYAGNRHNVGFMAVDNLVRRYSFNDFKKKFNGLVAEGDIDGERVLVLKPTTYMNLSGESVLAAASFYKIAPKDIIVIHDDMDLEFGRVKVKTGGGSGGHNGIKNIDSVIGPDYRRVRIGVARPAGLAPVRDWVLSDFSKDEKKVLADLFEKMADHIALLFESSSVAEAKFMNKIMVKVEE